MSRRTCPDCRRPVAACWCRYAKPTSTPHRVVVLQHPREARCKLGTVPILRRVLPATVVHVGVDFSAVQGTLTDPVLLFPGDGAPFDTATLDGGCTLVVLDGTWRQARSIRRVNPWLAVLPVLRLAPTRPSGYVIRTQPDPAGLSTVEAVAAALVRLGGDPSLRTAFLRPLHAMVGMHLACTDADGADVLADPGALTRAGYLPAPE